MPGNQQDIDSIGLQISADASNAEQSLDKLCASLNRLKSSLENVGKYSNQLTKLSTAMSSLSIINTAKLASVSKSLSALGSINVKASGISLLTNSLQRLIKESANFDSSKIDSIGKSLQSITSLGQSSDSMNGFIKSINSFARSGQKMKETANAFPALALEMQEFFDSMQNVTIADNTVRMAEALAQIAKSGKNASAAMQNVSGSANYASVVGRGLNKVLDSIISALKKIGGGALNGIKTLATNLANVGRSSSGVSSLTSNIKTLLGTMLGFRGIVGVFNWSKQMMKMGADVTEIDHIVKSVFGEDMVGYVNDWANDTMEKFGIASTAAKQYAGTMSAMFQASNVSVKDSNQMATDLVGLAGDLSAFYNIDTETAYNKIKSGMAGMVRPLRDLGIDLSVATLKEYALAQGIDKSWTSMTQAEKVMLRYRYLMDQTGMQQGDFA